MATDATGTPTSPDSIPTYNTSADAPSGLGFNAAMAAIQTALSARISKPSGLATGEFPVYNGTTFDRSTTTRPGASSLGTGTPDATKFLRGDGSWQVVSAGPTITRALTPPGSPADGDIWYYVDSLTATTVQWAFRWNAGSSNTDKWEFIGGSPVLVEVTTDETTVSTTYAALTTAGPSFTIPRGGVYQVGNGFTGGNTGVANSQLSMSYDIGGTGAATADEVSYGVGNAGMIGSAFAERPKTIAAATALVSKYKTSAGTAHFARRFMKITPIRVS